MGQRVPPISKQLLCQLECIGETQVVAVKRRSEQIQLGCQGRSEPPPYGAVRGNSATKPGQDRTGQDRTINWLRWQRGNIHHCRSEFHQVV